MPGLKDRYCIVGVGETEYSRHSGRSTRAMAVEAIRKAAHTGLPDDGLIAVTDLSRLVSIRTGDEGEKAV